MQISIEFSSYLTRFTSGKSMIQMDVDEGTTAAAAAKLTGIPQDEIGFVTVNNVKVDESFVLKHNDRLRVYPVIIGG